MSTCQELSVLVELPVLGFPVLADDQSNWQQHCCCDWSRAINVLSTCCEAETIRIIIHIFVWIAYIKIKWFKCFPPRSVVDECTNCDVISARFMTPARPIMQQSNNQGNTASCKNETLELPTRAYNKGSVGDLKDGNTREISRHSSV